jgi:hypothetical protein
MQKRTGALPRIQIDIPFLIMVAFFFVGPFIAGYTQTEPTNLQSQAGLLATLAFPLLIALFAIYWGFTIRKGLAVWLYRNQALGISLFGVGYFLFQMIGLFAIENLNNPFVSNGNTFFATAIILVILAFYLVDSSMRASQDSDPLSRDSLHWSKLRYMLWALNIVGVIALFSALAEILATGNYSILSSPTGLFQGIVSFLASLPIFVTSFSAIVSLPVAAKRSKDKSLRRQLVWFALSVLTFLFPSFILTSFVPSIVASAQLTGYIQGLGFTVGSYCLYKSARALVPLNRVAEEIMPIAHS